MKKEILILLILIFAQFVVKSQEDKFTKSIVAPYLNYKISKDSNTIYCSTFQIAWNELKNYTGGNVIIDNPIALTDSLNNGVNARKYISSNNYLVKALKADKKSIKILNKDIRKKFGNSFSPINYKPNPNDLLIYSFLYKKLDFKQEYEKIRRGLYFQTKTEKTKVKAFGIKSYKSENEKHQSLTKQTQIFNNSNDEFAVVLSPKNSSDQIILSEIAVSDTTSLLGAYNYIMGILNSSPIPFSEEMSIQIPVVKFNLNHSFKELVGKTIFDKKNNKSLQIVEAYQNTSFKLNQKGAVAKSKAKHRGAYGSVRFGNSTIIKFDRPFFIILKERNAKYPYLVIWVANPNLLETF